MTSNNFIQPDPRKKGSGDGDRLEEIGYKGLYKKRKRLNTPQDYISYFDGTDILFYRAADGVTLPYRTDPKTYPTPDLDPNLEQWTDVSLEQVTLALLNKATLVATLADAVALEQTAGYVTTVQRTQYKGGALYEITSDTPNTYDKIAMDNGKTLTLTLRDKFVTIEQLGAEPSSAFDSHPIIDYAIQNYQFITNELSGVYYVSDEIIPKAGTVFVSDASSNSTAVRDLELAVLPLSDFTGKAVVRASDTPLGGSLGSALSGIELGPFDIDAAGADVGLYGRYITNESFVHRITVRNSNVCNINLLTTWFAKYEGLISMRAEGKGISLGYDLFGETGDLAINAVEFEYVRSNFAGQSDSNVAKWVDGVDVKLFATDGAGVILKTNACHYPTLQAEKGIGVGIVDLAPFSNSFGSVYTEGNCSNMTVGRADFVGKNTGSFKVNKIQTVFIGATGDNAYYLEDNCYLDVDMTTRNSSNETYITDVDGQVIMRAGNSLATGNQSVDALAYDQFNYSQHYNINVRYSGSFDDAYFYNERRMSFPYVVIVPRANYTLASALQIRIDGNALQNYGTSFTAGVPVIKRHASINGGSHKLITGGSLPTADTFFDIYVFERRPSTGFARVS